VNKATKVFQQLNKINIQIKKKSEVFKKMATTLSFALFFGFVLGNIFGTFLPLSSTLYGCIPMGSLRAYNNNISWNGFSIIIIVLLIEFISYLHYHKK